MYAIASILVTAVLLVRAPLALAADRFVSTLGSDGGNDCLLGTSPCQTVGHGLAQAASGDGVKVAAGLYRENVVISTATTLTLSGGWSEDFSSQDPEGTPTVLRAAEEVSVITVIASGITIDFSADGLTIEKGRNFSGSGGSCLEIGGGGMCTFVDSGGDVTLALSRLLFQKNRVKSFGGGFGAHVIGVGNSLAVTVTDSTFKRNQAAGGGGFYIFTDQAATVTATLDRVRFLLNVAGFGGGFGISQGFSPTDAKVLIRNSHFERNRVVKRFDVGEQGGGLFAVTTGCDMSGCPLTVENSVFFKNRAPGFGGGIRVAGGFEIVNVTATGNSAGKSAGGVGGNAGIVRNSILWGNRGNDLEVSVGGAMELESSDVGEQVGSFTDLGGNISADPLFVRELAGDVHLTAGSPAIDSGTCTGAPATDFEGDLRPTGSGCDMGADEFVP